MTCAVGINSGGFFFLQQQHIITTTIMTNSKPAPPPTAMIIIISPSSLSGTLVITWGSLIFVIPLGSSLARSLSFDTRVLTAVVVNCLEIVCAFMFVSSTDSLMSGILIENVICVPSDNKRRRLWTVPVLSRPSTVTSDTSTPASLAKILLNPVSMEVVISSIFTGM